MQTRFINYKCRKITSIVASGMVLFWAPAAALAANWTPWTTANSPSNVHHDATYDSANQRIVLCGRSNSGFGATGQAECYFFTQAGGWQVGPGINSPGGNDIEVAYDSTRAVTVLYTVTNTIPMVFELVDNVWTQRTFVTQPVACPDGALMRYDPVRQRTVLVGYTNLAPVPGPTYNSETWLWDGTNWTQVIGSPLGAAGGSMTFDEARGVMVLLPYFATNTWTFDGSNWTSHQTAHVPSSAVWVAKMAYDPVNEVAIEFGGEPAVVPYPTNTWAWNGSDWQMLTTTNYPPATIDMAMLWFPPMNSIVMHGGWGPADSWAWRNSVWVFSNAPALSTPEGVTASEGVYTDKVAVVWRPVDNATGYRVYRSESNDTALTGLLGASATTNYDDTSAAATGTVYYYWVRATNSSGISAYSLSAAGWRTNFSSNVSAVASACLSADFDGDRLADPALFNTNGNWKIKLSSSGYSLLPLTGFLGDSGATALAADFDGDAKSDPTVYYADLELWAVKLSSIGYLAPTVLTSFGGSGWEALAGDFDGDRLADPVLYNTNGTWKVKLSTAGYTTITSTGLLGYAGWTAIASDFDGDGKVDPAIYDASTGSWIVLLSKVNYAVALLDPDFLGSTGYTGMAADFDGDGLADPAVAETSTGHWKIKLSISGYGLLDLPGFLGE